MKTKLVKSWHKMRHSVVNVLKPNSVNATETPDLITSNIRRKHSAGRVQKLKRRAYRYRKKSAPLFLFAKEMLVNPRAVGAACPSSRHLATAMARQIAQHKKNGKVVELGGGTGTVTRALLQQGITADHLSSVELSPALAKHLRERFPHINVIEGDACKLKHLLGRDAKHVTAVISGLPLRSLPQSTVRAIMQQIQQILPKGGVFVQFTYDLRSPSTKHSKYLTHISTQMIWRNFPPARVDTFQRSDIA